MVEVVACRFGSIVYLDALTFNSPVCSVTLTLFYKTAKYTDS